MFAYYYQVLGVTEHSSSEVIKHAYRHKAKLYHPDTSKYPNAHQRFVELTEAYEFLFAHALHKEKYTSAYSMNNETNTRTGQDFVSGWMKEERDKARKKAAYYARMRYMDYKKSAEFKTTSIMSSLLDFFSMIFGLMVITGSVYGLYTILSGNDEITVNQIVMAFALLVIGLIMFVFSLQMIIKNKKASAKEAFGTKN